MAPLTDSPILAFKTKAEFARWIARQKLPSPGVWVKFAKKGARHPSITYDEAIEIALIHGWIDGQKNAFDAEWWLQRFTPRTSRSRWSKINCDKAERLIAAGAMKPGGQKQIDAAKADGRWEQAYAGARTMGMPDDFKAALKRNRKAGAFYATISGANRYAILYRLHDAKRPETRAKRLAEYVAMLAEGKTIHPEPTKR